MRRVRQTILLYNSRRYCQRVLRGRHRFEITFGGWKNVVERTFTPADTQTIADRLVLRGAIAFPGYRLGELPLGAACLAPELIRYSVAGFLSDSARALP